MKSGKKRLLIDGSAGGSGGSGGNTSTVPQIEVEPPLAMRNPVADVDDDGASGQKKKKGLFSANPPPEVETEERGLQGDLEFSDSVAVDAEEGGDKKVKEVRVNDDEDHPKLADGFFEIEDIRKKRVVKGQLQYLIKWRGWPETANTWEPYDNIELCADIIQSFEERSRSQPRKNKRKASSSLVSATKKKQTNNTTTTATANMKRNSLVPTEVVQVDKQADHEEKFNSVENTGVNAEMTAKTDAHPLHGVIVEFDVNKASINNDDEIKEPNDEANVFVNLLGASEQPNGSTDAISNAKSLEFHQDGGRSTGARKRKSNRVKRFDPSKARDENDQKMKEAGDLKSTENDETNNKVKDDGDDVVKILVPVEFSTSMFDNKHDVSLTFKALSSNGKEILVTNKSLKVTNPQLLISFYEQHLRYG